MTAELFPGATRVNEELDVGYDADFERRWHRAERVGRVFMGLSVLVALSGLMGQGPLSHRTHYSLDRRVAVDFEPIARHGTTTQVTLHVMPLKSKSNLVDIFLSPTFVEPMGLQHSIPLPDKSMPDRSGIMNRYQIHPQSGDALIRFVLKPSGSGIIHNEISCDGDVVTFTQFVLP